MGKRVGSLLYAQHRQADLIRFRRPVLVRPTAPNRPSQADHPGLSRRKVIYVAGCRDRELEACPTLAAIGTGRVVQFFSDVDNLAVDHDPEVCRSADPR